jgi:hypothetical protein
MSMLGRCIADKDFELLDVWEYPIVADPTVGESFARFTDMLDSQGSEEVPVSGAAGLLFRIRWWLGSVFNLDEPTSLPIPGCEESSVRERMTADERARHPIGERDAMGFRQVYVLDDELLKEISNDTVHALLHVGWVQRSEREFVPQLAVYAKTRGRLGQAYMALIAPFRHLIVYPALMRTTKQKWEQLRS